MSLADLREQLAVELPGDSLTPYIRACQELGCFVWTGTFLERDSNYPDAVFNTTCLVGPTGLLAKYRKVNPWVPWEVHASPHDIADYPDDPFPVVETEIGRLGAAICYDWLFPETLRELAFKGAEVLVRVSAYMDPWGHPADGLVDALQPSPGGGKYRLRGGLQPRGFFGGVPALLLARWFDDCGPRWSHHESSRSR